MAEGFIYISVSLSTDSHINSTVSTMSSVSAEVALTLPIDEVTNHEYVSTLVRNITLMTIPAVINDISLISKLKFCLLFNHITSFIVDSSRIAACCVPCGIPGACIL